MEEPKDVVIFRKQEHESCIERIQFEDLERTGVFRAETCKSTGMLFCPTCGQAFMTEEAGRESQVEGWAKHCINAHNTVHIRLGIGVREKVGNRVSQKLRGMENDAMRMNFENLKRAVNAATYTKPCQAVEGLRMYTGLYACRVINCGSVLLSEKSFKNHLRLKHPEKQGGDWEAGAQRVDGQIWGDKNSNQTKKVFAINPRDNQSDKTNTSQYSARLIEEFDEYSAEAVASAPEICDTRVVARDHDDLEFFANFDRVVNMDSATKHSGWVRGNEGGDGLNILKKYVGVGTSFFFLLSEEETKKAPVELKQTINMPETSLGKKGSATFTAYQEESTSQRTAACVSLLLTFVMVVCNKDKDGQCPMLPKGYVIDINNKDSNLADVAIVTYEKIMEAGVNEPGSGAEACCILLPLIKAVFLRRVYGSDNDDIIKKFVVIYHTKGSGRRDESGVITTTLSGLIYVTRLALVNQVARIREKGEELRTEKLQYLPQEEKKVAWEKEMTTEDGEVQKMIELYAHTRTVRVTAFSTLFSFRALLNSLASGMAEPKINLLPNGSILFNSGKSTTFQKVKEVTLKAFEAIEGESARLFGAEMDQLELLGTAEWKEHARRGGTYDNLQNTDVGYSFATEMRLWHGGQLDSLKQNVLSAIRTHEDAMLWLQTVDGINGDLFTLIQHDTGGPVRGTTMDTTRITNSIHQIRSVKMYGPLMGIMQSYDKRRNLGVTNRACARFPSDRLSKLITFYILVTREVASFLACKFYCNGNKVLMKNMKHIYGEYLFVARGERLMAPDLSRLYSATFEKHSEGCKLNMSDYRHLAQFGMNMLCAEVEHGRVKTEDRMREVFNRQMGHSVETGETKYAIKHDGDTVIPETRIIHWYNASRKWQEFLYLKDHTGGRDSVVGLRSDSSENEVFAAHAWLEPSFQRQTLETSQPACPVTMMKMAFAALARVSDGRAPTSFKSREQAEAFMIMAARKMDAIIILPTGSGKSLPYQMLHLVEGGLVTVLLVTIKAALNDQIRRLTVLNIPHVVYDEMTIQGQGDVPRDKGLLLVQVENLKKDAYWNLIHGLSQVERLGRVVIDEVHLVETHGEFREFAAYIGKHALYNWPIVGISATVPPSREASLMRTLNIEGAIMLRRSSDRPELKFSSIEVPSEMDIPKQVASTVAGWNLTPRQRGIVYVMRQTEVVQVQIELNRRLPTSCGGVFMWKASNDEVDKKEQVRLWRESAGGIMVATTGLLMGIDEEGVAGIVFAYGAYSLEDVQQGAGRAARCPAVANIGYVTMVHAGRSNTDVGGKGGRGEDIRLVQEMMMSKDKCRRYSITLHCDGVGITCNAVPMSQYCDVCESTLPRGRDAKEAENSNLHELGESRSLVALGSVKPDFEDTVQNLWEEFGTQESWTTTSQGVVEDDKLLCLPRRRDGNEDENPKIHSSEESISLEWLGSVKPEFKDAVQNLWDGIGSQESCTTTLRTAMGYKKLNAYSESGTVVSNITGSQGSYNKGDEKTIERGTGRLEVRGRGIPEPSEDGMPAKRRLIETQQTLPNFVPYDNWQGYPAVRVAGVGGGNAGNSQNDHGGRRHVVLVSVNQERTTAGIEGLGMPTRAFHPMVTQQSASERGKVANPYLKEGRSGEAMNNPYRRGPEEAKAGRDCPIHSVVPYQKQLKGEGYTTSPYWNDGRSGGIDNRWRGSPVEANAGCDRMPMRGHALQAHAQRNVPRSERNNCGPSILARKNDSAGRADANRTFGEKFENKFLQKTKYGCVVCTIVGDGTEKKDHQHCMGSLELDRNTCKSCLSNRHLATACPAKEYKRGRNTCWFCLRTGEYHKVVGWTKCPKEWNDLLWNTVFLMMRYKNLEFRSTLQNMGFQQGEHGDVAKQENVAKFLSEYVSRNAKGVNGFMEFFMMCM